MFVSGSSAFGYPAGVTQVSEPALGDAVARERVVERAELVADTAEAPDDASPSPLASCFALRFVAVYFALYVFPFPLTYVPVVGAAARGLGRVWDPIVPWVGAHVLRLAEPITIKPAGSGDTTWNYVQLVVLAALATLLAAVWTWADRRRRAGWIGSWLWIAVRYYLAFTMFTYGFAKVFKTQFPFPLLERLSQPLGEASPMGLLWTMMGYSRAYNLFTGGVEVLGGAVLLFRRTATLGALVALAAMANVAMLNFAYDVPVKLYSMHLLLMAAGVAWPARRRLLSFLVLNRPALAADLTPPVAPGRWNRVRLAVKTLLVGAVVLQMVIGGWRGARRWGDLREKPPLYGIWEVERFVADGRELPPLLTDGERWRYLIVDRDGFVSIRATNGAVTRHAFEVDPEARSMGFATFQDRETKHVVSYRELEGDGDRLRIEGELFGRVLEVDLVRKDAADYLLVDRGFHWINEVPFNR